MMERGGSAAQIARAGSGEVPLIVLPGDRWTEVELASLIHSIDPPSEWVVSPNDQLRDRLKRGTLLAGGTAAVEAIEWALANPRGVRRMIFIDPSIPTVPRPRFSHIFDRIFPQGLPRWKREGERPIESLLHRLRCPVLVVRSSPRHPRIADHLLMANVPNAYYLELNAPADLFAERATDEIRSFLDAPARMSQKNRSLKE